MKKFLIVLLLLLGGCSMPSELNTYNHFVHPDGLFEFKHLNRFEVRNFGQLYYLKELQDSDVVFQIFPENSGFEYDEELFSCFDGVCHTLNFDPIIFHDLRLNVDVNSDSSLLSRGETLKIVLDEVYPGRNFDQFRDDCFPDVGFDHEYSGYICFAKENEIVKGIAGMFFPEQSINLLGILKVLFVSYGVDDLKFDEDLLEKEMFELMTKEHAEYDRIAKAYLEGIFLNTNGKDIWPNKNVERGEAIEIIERFESWYFGQELKDYDYYIDYESAPLIYAGSFVFGREFVDLSVNDFVKDDEFDYLLRDLEDGLGLYALREGNSNELIYVFEGRSKDEVQYLFLNYNSERVEASFLVKFRDGEEFAKELVIAKDEFVDLKSVVGDFTVNESLLPRNVGPWPSGFKDEFPIMSIFMDEGDFETILKERTTNSRYPIYFELNGVEDEFESSAVIKTRGNASRGYIKSSFSLESFYDFVGEGFLDEAPEVKLRSHISDESLTREKLIYKAFENLGYPSPNFVDIGLEIQNIPFGLYQMTEQVDQRFFERRGIDTKHYFYARNIASELLANLYMIENPKKTLKYYKSYGDEDKLIDLIERIEVSDKDLLDDLNVQNIFDYALVAYMTNANDSLAHNYYVYIDEETDKWNIFFWDADAAFGEIPEMSFEDFLRYSRSEWGWHNGLVNYLFHRLSDKELLPLFEDFRSRYFEKVNMAEHVEYYVENYYHIMNYENDLWNGKFLERKLYEYDSYGYLLWTKWYVEEMESRLTDM